MRPPSVTLRVDPDLVAEVRELVGPRGLTEALNAAMRLWIASQRTPESPNPTPPVTAPIAAEPPPLPDDVRMMRQPTLPSNAFRPPGTGSRAPQ
jgi:hypothetical protein